MLAFSFRYITCVAVVELYIDPVTPRDSLTHSAIIQAAATTDTAACLDFSVRYTTSVVVVESYVGPVTPATHSLTHAYGTIQAAATTVNAAYTVADTLPRARSSNTGPMDDEAGYMVPSPMRSSGTKIRGCENTSVVGALKGRSWRA